MPCTPKCAVGCKASSFIDREATTWLSSGRGRWALSYLHIHRLPLAASQKRQRHGVTWALVLLEVGEQVSRLAYLLVIHGHDNVAAATDFTASNLLWRSRGAKAGLSSAASGLNRLNYQSARHR